MADTTKTRSLSSLIRCAVLAFGLFCAGFAVRAESNEVDGMALPNNLKEFLSHEGVEITPDIWFRDWTDHVPEIETSDLYWVIPRGSSQSLMIANVPDLGLRVMNRAENRNLIVPMLVLPRSNDYDVRKSFVRHLIAVLFDPQILICDRRFAAGSDRVLATYLRRGSYGLEDLRRACSVDVQFLSDDRHWFASARVMESSGAIRDVSFSSTYGSGKFDTINDKQIFSESSFYFADEF